jgi:hypothetical protein
MLKESPKDSPRRDPPIAEHRLWLDGARNTPSLGCWNCPERGICGGLSVAAGLMNCLDLCCATPDRCDKPCRNNPDFALRVREVGTFSLNNVPRAPVLAAPSLPLVATVLFHRLSCSVPLGPEVIALPLYGMFNRGNGELRFDSHEALCAAFGLVPGTQIILTGTDQDPPLERWWGYEGKRREIIRGLKALGVFMTTTPNFSLFVDVPRHVDLHAIKRIGLVHWEFLDEGLPAALHINGRSETDFRRWGAYIRERAEITHLAYEFTTGTGRAVRREQHADWLGTVAAGAGRPLDLIVRGGIELLPRLTSIFNQVTVLETWSFMKTINRQRAVSRVNKSPAWRSAPTAVGAPLDSLFALNRSAIRQWIEKAAGEQRRPAKLAAAGR